MLSVLYVDDEEALLDITRIFLERSGELKIDTCSNPNDALDLLRTRTFDVIVSDYEMPELNGIELLKRIKSQGLDIPFIIFTGRGREIVAIEALNNGAAFYLQKGGDPKSQFAELKNMIRRAAEHKQVERKLQLTQFSVDRASDEVFWIDPSGKFLFVNNAACKSKGYTQAELLSMTIFDINPCYTPLSWSERFRENKMKGSLSYESTHKRKDGSVFPVEIASNYLTFDGNEYFFAFARDISGRKQNEIEVRTSNEQMAAMIEQIRTSDESIADQFGELERQKQRLFESENRYREIFDNAPLGIFNSTPEGKILRVNHEFARIFGYDSADEITEVINRSTIEEAIYENPSLRAEVVRDVTNSGKWQHFENRYRKKDGTIVTGRLIFRSFINSKSGGRELEGFLEDISAQKKMLDTLERNEDRFRILFERVPLGYQSLNSDGNFIEVNDAWLETMGYSREEVIGHGFGEFLAPEYLNVFRSSFPKFKEAGEISVEFEMIKKDGSRVTIAFEGKCSYDKRGNLIQTHCILQDITKRKQLFDRLKKSEELFREVFNNANDAIILHEMRSDGLPGKILMANDIACTKTGYGRDELLKMSATDLVLPVLLPNITEIAAQAREKGHILFQTTHRDKRGNVVPVELNAHIFLLEGKPVGLTIVRDISERDKNVTRIHEAMARTETLVRVAARLNASLDLKEVMNAVCEETAHALHVPVATLSLYDTKRQVFIPLASYGIPPEHKDAQPAIPLTCYQKTFTDTERVRILRFPEDLPETETWAKDSRINGSTMAVTPMIRGDGFVGLLAAVSLTAPLVFSEDDKIMLQAIADHAALAISNARLFTERKRDTEQIKETAVRLETILHVAAHLNDTLDPDEVMRSICEETAKSLDAPVVLLYIFDVTRKVFVPTADYGILPEFRKFQSAIPHSFYEKIFSDGKKVTVLPDVQLMPYVPGLEIERLTGVRTVLAATIERKGNLMGMLTVVTFGNVRTFTDTDQSLFKGLADETALALSNARLFAAQKNSEDAILKANKKLNILSSVTRHDILNKLTVLRAYMDLMEERVTDPKTILYIQAQEKAAQAIAEQIDFTKTYQDLGVRHPEWQDIDQVIGRGREQIDLNGIRLESNLKEVSLYADPLIEKVFYNLIDNSIRYGEKITRISLSSKQEPSGFTLIYEDDGIGIPDKDKKRIFERGVGKNTGLGLFLVREILSITGMTIDETGVFGNGARFEIHVPASDIHVKSLPQ